MSRPIHKNNEVFDLLDYGVAADGATDDTAAVLACIQASQNFQYGPGIIRVPRGRIALKAVGTGHAAILLDALASGMIFEGHGKYQSVFTFTEDNAPWRMFGIVDAENVEFRNLGFDGRVPTPSTVGWNQACVFRGCNNLNFHDNAVWSTGNTGIVVSQKGLGFASSQIPDSTVQCRNVSIYNNHFFDNYGSGGLLTKAGGVKDLKISNNTFERQGIQAVSVESEDPTDVTDLLSERIIITDNIIDDVNGFLRGGANQSWGMFIGENVRNVVASKNIISNVSGNFSASGIELSTSPTQSDTPVDNISLNGNVIDNVQNNFGFGHGIRVSSGPVSRVAFVTITGNTVRNVSSGLTFNNTDIAGPIDTHFTITGNTILGSDFGIWSEGATGPDIFTITGNTINAQTRGIRIRARIGNITGNTIRQPVIGIEILAATSTEDVDVNGNTIFATTKDVEMNGIETYFQTGIGYTWQDATGDHRIDAIQRPTSNLQGVVVGTQA